MRPRVTTGRGRRSRRGPDPSPQPGSGRPARHNGTLTPLRISPTRQAAALLCAPVGDQDPVEHHQVHGYRASRRPGRERLWIERRRQQRDRRRADGHLPPPRLTRHQAARCQQEAHHRHEEQHAARQAGAAIPRARRSTPTSAQRLPGTKPPRTPASTPARARSRGRQDAARHQLDQPCVHRSASSSCVQRTHLRTAYATGRLDTCQPPRSPACPRRPRSSLTREAIVDAAAEILDERGIDGLTMRAVAERLDAGAMSLYRHAADATSSWTW